MADDLLPGKKKREDTRQAIEQHRRLVLDELPKVTTFLDGVVQNSIDAMGLLDEIDGLVGILRQRASAEQEEAGTASDLTRRLRDDLNETEEQIRNYFTVANNPEILLRHHVGTAIYFCRHVDELTLKTALSRIPRDRLNQLKEIIEAEIDHAE